MQPIVKYSPCCTSAELFPVLMANKQSKKFLDYAHESKDFIRVSFPSQAHYNVEKPVDMKLPS